MAVGLLGGSLQPDRVGRSEAVSESNSKDPKCAEPWLFLVRDRVELGPGRDIQYPVGDDGGAVQRFLHVNFPDDFVLFAGLEDDDVAVLGGLVYFSVHIRG